MTPERWQQIDKLLELAVQQEPSRRSVFLDEACQGDAALRLEVESLLSAHGKAADFIETGPVIATAGRASAAAAQSLLGRQLGHYQILSRLGEGGMGIVYKARDQHLDRFVAIKVLPPELVADPERKRRLVLEAKAASALNHPNIITVYDISSHDSRDFIVMEYVEGKTLEKLIPRKGMPLKDSLKIAIPIADALAKAHAAGIIHRDLKPGNIMISEGGLVKVLDFGLAKLVDQKRSDQAEDTQARNGSVFETRTGVILGTTSYMSPEQAEGKPVDHRSDIFSFGAVLYEMLTGKRAFQGESVLAILTAVLSEEPKPVSQIVEGLPGELEQTVQRCLRKDPERRWQSIADVKVTLRDLQEEESSSKKGAAIVLRPRHSKRRLAWAAGSVVCVSALALAVWLWRSFRTSNVPPMAAVPLTTYPGHERSPSFSPDGNQVAFSWNGTKQDNFDIYVKLIGADPPLRVTTHRAEDSDPAWSPDGRWIAFLRDLGDGRSAVLLVPPIGGTEKRVGEIHKPWFAFGFPLTWAPDGNSLVVVDRQSDEEPYGLFVMSLESGEKRRLTSPPQLTRGDGGPAFSPDGRTIAFVRTAGFGSADLYLLPIGPDLKASGEPKKVTFSRRQVNNPAWTPDGRDLIVSVGFLGFGLFEASNLWRVSAAGSSEPEPLGVGEHGFALTISLEKHRLVYSREFSDVNIWRVGIAGLPARATKPERFISSTRDETNPQISSDGKKILFSSNRSGADEIWVCDQDGSNLTQLTSLGRGQAASPRWSPDDRWVAFDSNHEDGQFEVYVVEVGGGKVQRLTLNPAVDAVPSWSRDGKWIYFGSNRSGSYQVWRMDPSGGALSQVTQKGGFVPIESPDGKFVYYMKGYDDRHIWKVPSKGGEEVEVLGPVVRRDFDVTKDGIYFIPDPNGSKSYAIQFFSFATGEVKTVASIENAWGNYISVSPDGRWILYPQLDMEGSDLVLVENFR